MKRRNSSIILAMLDLISNAMAATIILFFILATKITPQIPPTRVLGTLYIKGSAEFNDKLSAKTLLWIEAPNMERKYGYEIFDIEKDPDGFGFYSYGYGIKNDTISDNSWIPKQVFIYNSTNNENEWSVIVRNPTVGEWKAGILYTDHKKLTNEKQAGKLNLSAMYVLNNKNKNTLSDTINVIAPTEYVELSIPITKTLDQ